MSGPTTPAEAFVQEVGALAVRLAEGRDSDKLVQDTQAFVDGVGVRTRDACTACADRLSRSAFAEVKELLGS